MARATYFQQFPVVELQQTFYEPPTLDLAAKWRAEAPADFQFCIKAWQLITHTAKSPTYRRLKSKLSPEEADLVGSFRDTEQVWLAWERTRGIARVLNARVVLFQCPASFRPTRENIANLRSFFARVDSGEFDFAWEPRGADWNDDLVRDLCTECNLIHCVDPFERLPVHGELLYWRLHGKGGYSYRYSDEDLAFLRDCLARYASRPAYVLFNNVRMKEDAVRFLKLVNTPE
jgi:uncharacterized protein YecE (DUF72 family)